VLLLQKEHIDLRDKFEFVLDLVQCLVEMAKARGSPLAESVLIVDGGTKYGSAPRSEQIQFITESQRCVEQLLLYMRVLQLVASAIQLAQASLKNGTLQPSPSIRKSK